MTYTEAEAYINDIPKFSKLKDADGCREILAAFGDPQNSFHYIHVAGTNGKGSVCAFLDSMLRRAGKRTGLFTSPHLITTAERMKVDGRDISREDFVRIFDRLMTVVRTRMAGGRPHPTYFEFLYLMAMIWFGEQGIEYGVIETGLGGRLDATNVIAHPVLTIITSISYDHMEILGHTIPEIAAEKAGIIKEGVPVICDGSDDEALAVIRQQAAAKKAPCRVVFPGHLKKLLNDGKKVDFYIEDMYNEGYGRRIRVSLNTAAEYQMMNSALALTAMRYLLPEAGEDLLLEGLAAMHWPGRLEEVLPGIYVDGAHNPGGIRSLTRSLLAGFADRRIYLIFAVASDKDYGEMIRELMTFPGFAGVIVTRIRGSRGTDLDPVAGHFARAIGRRQEAAGEACTGTAAGIAGGAYTAAPEGTAGTEHTPRVLTVADIGEAIRLGRQLARQEQALLLCAGSLYLAGDVLAALSAGGDNL